MIDKESLFSSQDAFIEALLPEEPLVRKIRQEALRDHVPAIPVSIGQILRLLIRSHQPYSFLEYGTGYGLSIISMAYARNHSAARFFTLELDERRFYKAKANIESSPFAHQIELLHQDFREPFFYEKLKTENKQFDFVFLDAAKGKYMNLLETIYPFVEMGGLLVFDDVFQSNWVLDYSYPAHRQKTAVLRLRDFLNQCSEDSRFICSLLAIDDGLLVLQKIR